MEVLLQPEGLIALLTLTLLEIVLGIDNIIFISIISNKLPEEKQPRARLVGLALALVMRVLMLLGISWIISFTEPLFSVFGNEISGRDLILAIGGLFLIAKSTSEIHGKIEGENPDDKATTATASFASVILQIVVLDIIFSLDSILTAIGMTPELVIMVAAVIIAMIIMMIFSGKISAFINRHPTLQMLALSFLILIGFMLVIESLDYHVPKGYIYFSVFFALIVEVLNMSLRKRK